MKLQHWTRKFFWQWCKLGTIAVSASSAVLGIQASGVLQVLELAALDNWFRLRSPEVTSVPITLVLVYESDITGLKQWPMSDAQLATVLNKIKVNQPAVIGLNFYRNLPIEPGHADLQALFRTTPNLIGVEKVGGEKAIGDQAAYTVSPPTTLRDRGQVAVNDLIVDPDNRVRRNLLSIHHNGITTLSLGARVALEYLRTEQIFPQEVENSVIHLGKTTFQPMQPFAGGYIDIDVGGYQTLSNFLIPSSDIPKVSLTDVLADRVSPKLFQGRIVLIGAKLESSWGDRFYTPYTAASQASWAGVELQANIAAQLIAGATEGRPLLQGVPESWEWGWILLCGVVGTSLGWSLRSISLALASVTLAICGVFGVAYGLFLLGWWMVAIAPLIALIMTALLSRGYWVWQALQETTQILELKVQKRTQELLEKNAALQQEIRDRQTAEQALENANSELRRLAHVDGLTQVANRRYFNEWLEREWQQAVREQRPITVVLIDVDFFKLYNDTYGHLAGDRCLTQVAAALQSVVKRPTDLLARYGGEEFVALLPNTPMAGAAIVAQEMRHAVAQRQILHEKSTVKPYITLSIGIASWIPTLYQSPELLVNTADAALYLAKQQGRDRVVLAAIPG